MKAFRVKVKAVVVPGHGSACCGGKVWVENEFGAPCFAYLFPIARGQNNQRRALLRAGFRAFG